MSSNLSKKNNETKNYNFIYSPVNITNIVSLKKDITDYPKTQSSSEQGAKIYYQNFKKSSNSQLSKDKIKVVASPNNHTQLLYNKSKMQKENNQKNSKNVNNNAKTSEQNSRSPISLTGRITNLHNIKLTREKNEEERKKNENSNSNMNNNRLAKSSYLIGHNNSKSVNSTNDKNKNIKYGNNLIIKTGNLNEGLNKLRKEKINDNYKNSKYNFNNNNHGIINTMNMNNTSKNKIKNENLNLGMLSFSTSNISVNNFAPPTSNNINNTNYSNNINVIKNNSNISDLEQISKKNLDLCLDNISNINSNSNVTESKGNSNSYKLKSNIQTKSAEQTTRNPKYFKSESIYNTNYIINFIDSNEIKNGKFAHHGNQREGPIYVIGQKDNKKNNINNNAYKELTNITKNNINEILSKKGTITQNYFDNKNEEKKNSDEPTYSSFINNFLGLNDGQNYKSPEELHFSMVKIHQNINKLKVKF